MPISVKLQLIQYDLVKVFKEVRNLVCVVKHVRTNATEKFKKIFKIANDLEDQTVVEILVPRICKKKTKRKYCSLRYTWRSYREEALEKLEAIIEPDISICVSPVTTSESERTFSTSHSLKILIRTTISEERLKWLALLYIHKDVQVDTEKSLTNLQEVGDDD